MKTTKNIALGFFAAAVLLVIYLISISTILAPLKLGSYDWPAYVIMVLLVGGYAIWRKWWGFIGGFAVGATLLFPPTIFLILFSLCYLIPNSCAGFNL